MRVDQVDQVDLDDDDYNGDLSNETLNIFSIIFYTQYAGRNLWYQIYIILRCAPPF